ncbi:MAG: hypothetical protein ACP6IS_10000 [Candidatus Asgardarchaeia archaeon]
MSENNIMGIRVVRGINAKKSKRYSFDATFILPDNSRELIEYLQKNGKANDLTLYIEGKDIKLKTISGTFRFLGILNEIIYCARKVRGKIKIYGVALTEERFLNSHEDILAKNVGVKIGGIRGPHTITNSIKNLTKWVRKVSLPKDVTYTLRLYLRGEFQGQRHFLEGIFASSEAGVDTIKRENKSLFKKILDVAIFPITLPFKIVELLGKELLKLFVRDLESGLFFVLIESSSFQYKPKYISVGNSKNALFKPDLYVAELVEKGT